MLIATLLAATAWTAPVPVERPPESAAYAHGALGGSLLGGFLERRAVLARRSGGGFGPFAPITAADRHETVWASGLAQDGTAVVLTVRRHTPTRRIRAILVAPDGTRGATRTISDRSHSATRPELAVAADGTAVAAWAWHDRAGWRAQAAIRRPGEPRFDAPQTLSPPSRQPSGRLWIYVAAGEGGRAVLTWQIGGADGLPEAPLHVRTAGPDARFGPDQAFAEAGGLADVGIALGPGGAVQLAYADSHFDSQAGPSSLRVAQGTAGAPLSAPVVLSKGGKGANSGRVVDAAFSADGTATVVWARPGNRNETGGTLEVFTRAAGRRVRAAAGRRRRREGALAGDRPGRGGRARLDAR